MPLQKIIRRALHGTENLTNLIIAFLSGIFLSAIFFLLMLKFIGPWGIAIALIASAYLNYWLKKKHREHPLLNTLNNGILTFDVLLIIIGATVMTVFFSAAQNLLS